MLAVKQPAKTKEIQAAMILFAIISTVKVCVMGETSAKVYLTA
jgi:hypothetical protein